MRTREEIKNKLVEIQGRLPKSPITNAQELKTFQDDMNYGKMTFGRWVLEEIEDV